MYVFETYILLQENYDSKRNVENGNHGNKCVMQVRYALPCAFWYIFWNKVAMMVHEACKFLCSRHTNNNGNDEYCTAQCGH